MRDGDRARADRVGTWHCFYLVAELVGENDRVYGCGCGSVVGCCILQCGGIVRMSAFRTGACCVRCMVRVDPLLFAM